MQSIKRKLREIVEDNTTIEGKIFDYVIQSLILLSLISFSVDTLPGSPEGLKTALRIIEVVCVIVFSIEYGLRIYVAQKPFKYIFSFYGLIDLIAILPFYITRTIDLRSLRVFRVFRIFRALKLVRYNRALRRFHIAFRIIREELILFAVLSAIMIFLSASGIYFFENKAQPELFRSIFHSLWWAVVTLTTVGYGDVYPVTIGGKIFTFFVLVVGIGIVTVPAGLVASGLSKARQIEQEEMEKKTTQD
ncbi:ion transporter [Prolixibacter bellariivorans]|uniref:Ion transporter n=1 Tax=Prolixibacter bellariivorans TaxID=314319 RepID=A0A5M4AV92_9BACT|nr:ion transporter [Prolixibacter bellariivorans]GET31573.1 ion transporter [Prolixibacter bellariivorans]